MENFDTYTLSLISICVVLALLFFRSLRQSSLKVNSALAKQDKSNQLLKDIARELASTNKHLAKLTGGETEMDSSAANEAKLYVGNIDYSVTEDELEELFNRFGKIEFVNIPVNRYNGKARGFGFVTFTSLNDAEKAIELNGTEFRGRSLLVNYAKDRD